jgi:hypothetical protein
VSLKLAPSDFEIYIPVAEWIEKNVKEWLFTQRPLFKKLEVYESGRKKPQKKKARKGK